VKIANVNRQPEKAVIAGLALPGETQHSAERSLDELARLVDTAGGEVIARFSQARPKPDTKYFIGKGKADEIAGFVKDRKIESVVVDNELSPSQQLNLEKLMDCKVVDRAALILDIFALHARSAEGKLQIELAQLNYYLPRLKGMWLHLGRLGGGIGTRGPGETQLEADRRHIRRKVAKLKKELAGVSATRGLQRSRRKKKPVFSVALVGYTNAGKSSLMRRLTGADVLIADQLFATLDSTTRRIGAAEGTEIVISDTVGFINKLPHELVAAFKSTLDEVAQADLLVHVIDATETDLERQIRAVDKVLEEIGAGEIERLLAYNKADLIDNDSKRSLAAGPSAYVVSSIDGEGVEKLLAGISGAGEKLTVRVKVKIPFGDGSARQWLYDHSVVHEEEHDHDGSLITAAVRKEDVGKIAKYTVDGIP